MDEYDLMGNYGGGYDDSYSQGYDYLPQPVAPNQPMSYDDFGNPVYNEEEARRKREEEQRQIEEYQKQQQALGSEVSHKQEVITYADGSQTVKTQKEVARPVNPNVPQSPQQAQMQTADQIRYNQDIQRQESGSRPDIGYHDQSKSSAYGPYGITQAAYEDARRQNPYLPEDIRQATPEQMTQAQNAVTQNNAKYLQSYGVPVNNNTLQAAHFLGAKGLSDYLKTGYISPAAAAANGGADRVRQIVNARLGGQPAAASGAAQQARPQMGPISPEQSAAQDRQFDEQFKQYAPAAQVETPVGTREPATAEQAPRMAPNSYDSFGTPVYSPEQAQLDQQLKTYESIQNDPKALMNFEGPDWMQARAKARAADVLSDERDKQKAMESIQKSTPKELARTMMREPTDRWEIIKKSAMFRLLGANSLADAELGKLSSTVEKYVQGADGKAYLLNMRPNGEVASGVNAETGQSLTDNELVKVSAGVQSQKGVHQSAEVYKDPSGKVKGSFVLETRPGQTPVYKEVGTGRVATADESAVLNKTGVAGTLDMQRAQQIQKQNIELAGDWAKLQMKVQGAAPEAANKFIGEFNAKHGTNFGIQSINGAPPQISMETGAVSQAAPMAATTAGAQGATTTAGVTTAGTTAGAGAQGAGAQGAGQKPGGVTYVSPADLEAQKKKIAETEKVERELGQKQSEGIIKHVNEKLVPAAANGDVGSTNIKEQLKIFNDPAKSNILFGLYDKSQTNAAGDKRWAMIRDLIGGKLDVKDTELSKAAAELGLNSDQVSALREYNALNGPLVAATVHAIGGTQISDRDRAAAEKMQVDLGTTPALGAFNIKGQQLFGFDLARYKSDWAASQNVATLPELEKAWRKEQATLIEKYGKVAEDRNQFIKTNAGNQPANIGLVREAYRRYPVPQYDPNLNGGNGGWRNLRDRDLNQILKGNR